MRDQDHGPRRPHDPERRSHERRRPGRLEDEVDGPVARRLADRRAEVVAADLNRDGTPELVFGTYGPKAGAGRLVVLSAKGKRLYDIRLRHQRVDGNGVGVPAAPSIADLDGDGRLEIVLTTFDHGIDVYRVAGSGTGCLPWPTGRGGLLRSGTIPPSP